MDQFHMRMTPIYPEIFPLISVSSANRIVKGFENLKLYSCEEFESKRIQNDWYLSIGNCREFFPRHFCLLEKDRDSPHRHIYQLQ